MTFSFSPVNSQSTYLPIEFQVEGDEQFFRQLIAERERLTSSIVNIKENASYETVEQLSAQQWFSTQAAGVQRKTRYGYRTTADLVALNGGPIGAGATAIVLSSTTVPSSILGSTIPLPCGGSATAADGKYLFLNESRVFVDFQPATQTITITNNYGANLTQCYYEFEYLKQ